VGLQYQLSEQTMLGVTYSEQSDFSLNGSVAATVIGPPPLPLASRFDAELDIAWPRSLGVGVKHDINACHRVSCDVIWYNWSAAFDEFTLTLTNPTDPTVAMIFGPTITETIPMRWKDTVSLRLGYEWMSKCRDVWRLGYVYHESPCPDATLTPYTDGVLEHAFALGLSRRYDRCLLNLAYQYSFSPERNVGASALAGGDFTDSTFQAQAHWASASVLIPF
jgi:long-subunit fatty acid transport protein